MNFNLKLITKQQMDNLRTAGLIKDKKVKDKRVIQEPNYYVANKEHMSRSKSYYIVEEPKIMQFLGYIEKPKWKYNKNKNKINNYNKKVNNFSR